MEHPDEFIKLLRQIMSQIPLPKIEPEIIEQAVREFEVLQLVNDSFVVWMN